MTAYILRLLPIFAICTCSCTGPALAQDKAMTLANMDKLLKKHTTISDGAEGRWIVMYQERQLIILTDPVANRMRIISPVIEKNRLSERLLTRVLEANFETALDARYALFEDYLWSAYIHPLRELTDDQFLDGMRQVVQLADNFGGSYSSTAVVFPASSPAEATDQP